MIRAPRSVTAIIRNSGISVGGKLIFGVPSPRPRFDMQLHYPMLSRFDFTRHRKPQFSMRWQFLSSRVGPHMLQFDPPPSPDNGFLFCIPTFNRKHNKFSTIFPYLFRARYVFLILTTINWPLIFSTTMCFDPHIKQTYFTFVNTFYPPRPPRNAGKA